jgi:thiol-disulfide isomerase/thioredoxin
MELSLRLHAQNRAAQASLGTSAEGALAAFAGATGWLNSPPLTAPALRGRVVLVQFWTFTCINWLRTLPYVRAWARRYARQGLVVIGVHTPEFDVERDVENVRRAAEDLRVDYPIALDSDYAIWEAFGNRFWPALHLIDAEGRIRHHRFGEGDEERSERVLQRLLTEAGAPRVGTELTAVDPRGVEVPADWDDVRSGETYLGYERTENFVSFDDEAIWDTRHVYGVPERLRLNDWGLSGDWTLRRQAAILNRAGGRIVYRFHARDLHLVMGAVRRGSSVWFRVGLDGRPPGDAHGVDADERGDGRVTVPRLYQLVRQPSLIAERTFEITFLDPGVRAYAVTFG